MILPLALVERWPSDYDGKKPDRTEIKNQFETIEQALKHTTHESLLLYREILLLEKHRRNPDFFPVENKKSKSHKFNKQLDPILVSKSKQLSVQLKYSDFPAMVMAAYTDAQLMDKSLYWDNYDTITQPVLVRGIAMAKYVIMLRVLAAITTLWKVVI